MIAADICRTERACVRIASSKYDLSEAFSLVYQRYLEAGLVERNAVELRLIPHHALPTTEVVVAHNQNQIVCTASIIRDNLLGLPMESVYSREVDLRRQQKLCLAEVSCLADRRGATSRQSMNDLMAFIAQCAKIRGVDQILIAVHPRHVGFYTRCLGFDVFAGLRSYDSVRGNPALGLSLDLNSLQARSPAAYRRLFGPRHSKEQLAYCPLSTETKRYVKQSLQIIASGDFTYRSAALAS